MKIITEKQKAIWNEAVNEVLKEVMKYDGFIPLKDRKAMTEAIAKKLLYKRISKEYL